MPQITTFASANPGGTAILGVCLLVALALAYFAARAAYRATARTLRTTAVSARKLTADRPAEDVLTLVAASIATGVSAQGMWRFSGDVLGLDGPLRVLLFAFVEVAIVTSAVRARRNMREKYSAGIDGLAVWAFTCLTAVLSSMDARSPAEAIFRLAAPLVAAWLWERGMAVERHRLTGRSRIKWRITPERAMVWLGVAEAKDRTASEVDVQRRLTRAALASVEVTELEESGGSDKQVRKALAALRRALQRAEEHTDLASNPATQRMLLDKRATLRSGKGLTQTADVAPWSHLNHPSLAPAGGSGEMPFEARKAIADYAAWKQPKVLPFPVSATGHVTPAATRSVTGRQVTSEVTPEVTETSLRETLRPSTSAADVTPAVTPAATPSAIADAVTFEVADEVTFDVTDPNVFDLSRLLADGPGVTRLVTPSATADEVTDEVTDDDPDTRSKTDLMRAHWNTAVAEKRYPLVAELAEVAGAHHSLASRKRAEWVAELPWQQRRKAAPRREKATA